MAEAHTNEQLEREIEEAIQRGERAAEQEHLAADAWYDAASGRVMIELKSGILFGFPPERAQGLRGASARELADVEVEGDGYGLHWESLDADLAVPGLVTGVFGTEAWMRELGRRGGSTTSDAKRSAARQNGLKGGRPRKAQGVLGAASNVHTLPSPHGDGWINKQSGKVVSKHARKESAVARGRELAQSFRGEHVIHRRDGAISKRKSYGNDPGHTQKRVGRASSG